MIVLVLLPADGFPVGRHQPHVQIADFRLVARPFAVRRGPGDHVLHGAENARRHLELFRFEHLLISAHVLHEFRRGGAGIEDLLPVFQGVAGIVQTRAGRRQIAQRSDMIGLEPDALGEILLGQGPLVIHQRVEQPHAEGNAEGLRGPSSAR